MNYAGESIAFLSERTRWKYAYATALIACVLVGAYSTPHAVLALTDGIVTALTALNLLTLVAMRREVLRETKNWLGNKG
jgi:Na+/alanine symporter